MQGEIRLQLLYLPIDLGGRSNDGLGLGIIVPDFFETLTFLPSSRYLLFVLVGLLTLTVHILDNQDKNTLQCDEHHHNLT